MKRVLLISNYVFHYRQKIYNHFAERFEEDGYEFHVLSNDFQDVGYQYKFVAHQLPMAVNQYTTQIREILPDIVIVFLQLKDKIQIPLIHYCRRKHIPVIFWNKGVSDTDPKNFWKNVIYHHIHNCCDALITYTPEMKRNFKHHNWKKLFVAYNTVDCTDIVKNNYDKMQCRKKYGIKEEKIVLYISRMKESKRIDVLLDALANCPDVAVVAMGAGMTQSLQKKFDLASNLYYVGEKYGSEGNEVWAMGDVFSIPASVGLGINEAIFWGLPIVTMRGFQPPEIFYLKDGVNGFIANTETEYKEKLLQLLHDDNLREQMKQENKRIYNCEVHIDNMYKGFLDAIRYCENAREK